MHAHNRFAFHLAWITTILALIVVLLGAYTRLKDAGLGCPDWPGCYGQVVAPDTPERIVMAAISFPAQPVDTTKAWTEMVHRYVAGTLGTLIVILSIAILWRRRLPHQPIGLALALIAIVLFQALLGKWTVTMRLLPIVVMGHLLGGMLLLSLLWLLTLRLNNHASSHEPAARQFRPWAWLGLAILVVQIILGGWTSTNYAALICPDFPFCQGRLIPPMDLGAALAATFQQGHATNIGLMTIQVLHRLGALITGVYLLWLSGWMALTTIGRLRHIAITILILLVLQIGLGIINVVWLLPVTTAVAHNGIAALLLLTLVTLNYRLNARRQETLAT